MIGPQHRGWRLNQTHKRGPTGWGRNTKGGDSTPLEARTEVMGPTHPAQAHSWTTELRQKLRLGGNRALENSLRGR